MLQHIINHLRNREYMSGVERDKNRTRATGEVFTPTALVRKILDRKPIDEFIEPTNTFIDPSCGDGQFLSEVVIKKMENGSTYGQALETTYGVDLMEDNCFECIRRLYMATNDQIDKIDKGDALHKCPEYKWSPGLKAVFKVTNEHYNGIAKIVCADALKYDYRFGEPIEIDNEQYSPFDRLFEILQ
jgi:hypothetical protein